MGKKIKLPKDQRIGTCEAGEIAFNLDAFDRLYDGNIIITKRLTNKVIEKLIEHKDKIILHLTCTGMGGTRIEPLVPKIEETLAKLKQLIEGGFPLSHIVLRIDPIIPTDKGVNTAIQVLATFSDIGIERVRLSFLDMYKHVQSRFKKEEIMIPEIYKGNGDTVNFHASLEKRIEKLKQIEDYAKAVGYSSVEVCGEPGIESTSCLSQKDIDILGLTDKITLEGSAEQRKSCGCPANKSELLKVRPHQCENKCMYCYWN